MIVMMIVFVFVEIIYYYYYCCCCCCCWQLLFQATLIYTTTIAIAIAFVVSNNHPLIFILSFIITTTNNALISSCNTVTFQLYVLKLIDQFLFSFHISCLAFSSIGSISLTRCFITVYLSRTSYTTPVIILVTNCFNCLILSLSANCIYGWFSHTIG